MAIRGALAALLLGFGASVADAVAVAVPPPTLMVSQLPTAASPTATVSATWNTGSGVPGQLMLLNPGARLPVRAGYGNNGTATFPGVAYAKTYEFELVTVGLHHRLLATDTVSHGASSPHVVALSWIPPRTSAGENRLIQISPYAIGALFLILGVGYARSLRTAPA